MELDAFQVAQAVVAALLVGFTKTGVPGLGLLIVPLMASVFPARASVGALLPMLLVGDLFAIAYYRRHADWAVLAKLLPWVLVGLGLGYLTLGTLASGGLAVLLGVLVLSLIALKLVEQWTGSWLEEHLPHQWWFSILAGVLAGFATMVANVAGAITTIYFLSMGLQKRQFMGTAAWFYLTVNLIKVPFYASLGIITPGSLLFDLKVAGLIVLGALTGRQVFRLLPQTWFDRSILGLAALSAIKLLVW